jgi:hypothetical protein
MKMTRAATLMTAVTALLDVLTAVTAAPCTVTSWACGAIVDTEPTDFLINVSEAVDLGTVHARDLTVNGMPANSAGLLNGNTTIIFHFNTSAVMPGLNTIHIPAGAFTCGPPVDFNCTFRFNIPRPRSTPAPRP